MQSLSATSIINGILNLEREREREEPFDGIGRCIASGGRSRWVEGKKEEGRPRR